MEIKISKSELRQNFLTFADKIVETVREVSEKSVEEWGSAKLRTMTLYNSVLNRIKEKEIVIKTEYFKKPEVGLEEEATSLLEKWLYSKWLMNIMMEGVVVSDWHLSNRKLLLGLISSKFGYNEPVLFCFFSNLKNQNDFCLISFFWLFLW